MRGMDRTKIEAHRVEQGAVKATAGTLPVACPVVALLHAIPRPYRYATTGCRTAGYRG